MIIFFLIICFDSKINKFNTFTWLIIYLYFLPMKPVMMSNAKDELVQLSSHEAGKQPRNFLEDYSL